MAATVRAIRSGDPDRVRTTSIKVQQQRCEVVVRHLRSKGVLPQ
jgi:hypothetical protein